MKTNISEKNNNFQSIVMAERYKIIIHLPVLVVIVLTVVFLPPTSAGTPTAIPGSENNPELYYLEHVSPNTTSWIIIEPVPEHYWGDSFTINAITNLPVDQPIQLWGVPEEAIKDAPHNFGIISRYGFIGVRCTNYPGNPPYNLTSCPVDTADLHFPNMNYSIASFPGYSPGNISSINLRSRWVIVNPIGNRTIGENILINGTTDAPAGTNLSIYVEAPLCGRMKWQSDCTYETVYANAENNIFNPDARIFSTVLNTSGFRASSFYDVHVSGTGLAGNDTSFRLIDPSFTESPEARRTIRIVCTFNGPHGTELRDCDNMPKEASDLPKNSPATKTQTAPTGRFLIFISLCISLVFMSLRK